MERAELGRLLAEAALSARGGSAALPPAPVDGLVREADPARFKAACAAAVLAGGPVILGDAAWGASELAQFAVLRAGMVDQASKSSLAGGERAPSLDFALDPAAAEASDRGWLRIPTGGSSGRLKLARHDGHTLAEAVRGFQAHFGFRQVNAVGVLPLYHVSGFMAWLRCALTWGRHVDWSWKSLEAGHWPELPSGEDWVLSLVPTQLQRLLATADGAERLRRFKVIFIGGAPSWPTLLEQARAEGLRLSLGYGMTETAAMVCALHPEEFLAGKAGAGGPMPHARLQLAEDGTVVLGGASLFYGYEGQPPREGDFVTEDLGCVDEAGRLTILGRRDAMIITGGEKVAPPEVEAAIRAAGWTAEVAVLGAPDPVWGNAVVACVSREPTAQEQADMEKALRQSLAPFKRPKRWVVVSPWPVNAQGKVIRSRLLA